MKRILAFVLALCMVFALCACGDTSSEEEINEEAEELTDETESDETEENLEAVAEAIEEVEEASVQFEPEEGEWYPSDFVPCEPKTAYICTDADYMQCYMLYTGQARVETVDDLLEFALPGNGLDYEVTVYGSSESIGYTRVELYNGVRYWVETEYISDTSRNQHSSNCYSAEEIREKCSEQGVSVPTHFCPLGPKERILYFRYDYNYYGDPAEVRIFTQPAYTNNELSSYSFELEGRTYVRYYGQYAMFALVEFNGDIFWVESQYLKMPYGSDIQVEDPPCTLEGLADECERQFVRLPANFHSQEPELMVMYDPEVSSMDINEFIWGRRTNLNSGEKSARVLFTYIGRTPVYCYGYSGVRALISIDGELLWINDDYIIKPEGNNTIDGLPYLK